MPINRKDKSYMQKKRRHAIRINKRLLCTLIALVVINLMIAAFNFADAEPFDTFHETKNIHKLEDKP